MFKIVVWATDGSACADHALGFARSIAEREHSNVHVVHVDERLATGRTAGPSALVDEDGVQNRIKTQTQELLDEGLHCKLHLISADAGEVATSIAQIADDNHADVIIAGTRGHSPIAGLLLGSVTQRLLHTANCPVLVVPSAATVGSSEPSELAVSNP